MKANPAEYEFASPGSLRGVLELMSQQGGEWQPIAGGTDLMVQFAAGSLTAKKLVNIANISELRSIEVWPSELQIGAGCTYTRLREDEIVAREFPMLALAASWTGSIANQNRGTLGGNIVNASPAADSLPALLAYDAELLLTSVRGERRVAYRDFHTGYKQMELRQDELVRAVSLPRKFSGYLTYTRKVGARNAQAISKVCMAGLARVENGIVRDSRIALGSVAPTPIRLRATEQVLNGSKLDAERITQAQQTAASEISPISDIRSTAKYRAAVVRNLIAEFLFTLGSSAVLARWNVLPAEDAEREILACCGSRTWAREMVGGRPVPHLDQLAELSDRIWWSLKEADWMEAFQSHPRIGESPRKEEQSARWSAQEQSGVAEEELKIALANANREYEQRFGHIFIVSATSKTSAQLLNILQRRLKNDPQIELREAAEQQRQITQLRLRKWLAG